MSKLIAVAVICLALIGCTGNAGKVNIAKVNLSDLDTVVLDYVLSQTQNQTVKIQYEEAKKLQQTASEEMMRHYLPSKTTGKIEFDPTQIMENKGYAAFNAIDHTVKALVKSELPLIIKKIFGNKYQVVIKTTAYEDNVIYSDVIVPDITSEIQRYIINNKEK
ncbi:MAG: hypothetical protein NTU66_07460 [Elusimicrobia bacterium]|nr:hypothetical protein [Elusimicrobiota bacterium]